MSDTLDIKLNVYEGPLELLLHLIKKNEVDLNNLPLALITAQYLEYLETMEALDLERAGEFLLMAATLIHLKSAAVLPWPEEEEDTAEEERQRLLIRPLVEYAQARAMAEALGARARLGRDIFSRSFRGDWPDGPPPGEAIPEPWPEVSVMLLVEAFKKMAERKAPASVITFRAETKTLEERLLEVQTLLTARREVSFAALCHGDQSRADLILSFLAVLELAKAGFLLCRQAGPTAELWLVLPCNEA